MTAAWLLGCAVLASAVGPQRPCAEGPAELIATLRELEEQGRFGEILEHITPDQREAYLFMSWFDAAYTAMGSAPDVSQRYRTIVETHGLDEDWLSEDLTGRDGLRRVAEKAFRNVDVAALLHEVASFRLEHGRFGVAFGFVGELRGLHIEDDWARASIERSEFELVRQVETWFWCPFPDLDR